MENKEILVLKDKEDLMAIKAQKVMQDQEEYKEKEALMD